MVKKLENVNLLLVHLFISLKTAYTLWQFFYEISNCHLTQTLKMVTLKALKFRGATILAKIGFLGIPQISSSLACMQGTSCAQFLLDPNIYLLCVM